MNCACVEGAGGGGEFRKLGSAAAAPRGHCRAPQRQGPALPQCQPSPQPTKPLTSENWWASFCASSVAATHALTRSSASVCSHDAAGRQVRQEGAGRRDAGPAGAPPPPRPAAAAAVSRGAGGAEICLRDDGARTHAEVRVGDDAQVGGVFVQLAAGHEGGDNELDRKDKTR